MGTPGIFVSFKSAASDALKLWEKGTLLLLLKDAKSQGAHVLTKVSEIPTDISDDNKKYIERAFIGYENKPKKVLVYIDTAESENVTAGLAWATTQQFDYLCAPPTATPEECTEIVTWIKAEREKYHAVRAVLPNQEADYEGIINFTGDGIKISAEKTCNTAEYCSRIAGIIAGTPMKRSCTFAPLAEVQDITRLNEDEQKKAIEAGKLILIHDGIKVKLSRGVNSLKTTSDTKGKEFKKIKIIELIDKIQYDLRLTIADTYIGKYENSYDNKLVLVTAVQTYFNELELSGLVKAGSSVVEIDIDSQSDWLKENGYAVEDMTEKEIKEANTDSYVFIKVSFTPLDAIEDVNIPVVIR